MFKSFIKAPLNTWYDGEDQSETILYVLRSSLLTLIPWIMGITLLVLAPFVVVPVIATIRIGTEALADPGFLFVFILFWYLVTFGMFLQGILSWYFNVYVISNKKLVDIDFKGILYKNISEAALTNIEDVTSNVIGTLGIVFNIGTVYIQTAAETPEFEFANVDDPSKIRDIISDLAISARKNATGDPNN